MGIVLPLGVGDDCTLGIGEGKLAECFVGEAGAEWQGEVGEVTDKALSSSSYKLFLQRPCFEHIVVEFGLSVAEYVYSSSWFTQKVFIWIVEYLICGDKTTV